MNYNELISFIRQTNLGDAPPLSTLKKFTIYRGFQAELTTLNRLINNHYDENSLRDALKAFLANYWANYKKGPLSYTCIPKHPLTHLCINIAVFISDNTKEHPLSLLIPDLNLIPYDENQDDFPGLDIVPENQIEWLKIILATHIISDDTRSLIPIKTLNTLSVDHKSHEKLRLPYEFERTDGTDATYLVSPQAYLRLSNHSDYTRSITNAKKQIDIMDQEDNVLSQLRHLIKLLKGYSAHGGTGTQEDAAGAAYTAIIMFNAYYDKLSEDQKNMIPEEVKLEIELLLELSSQADKNTNATEQIETCIGLRTERLDYVITPHEKILSTISLSPDEQGTLTIDVLNAFKDAKEALEDALLKNQYHLATDEIQDNLILTRDLLRKLNIELAFHSTEDLELFASLTPEEITLLLKDNEIKNNIIRYFLSHPRYAMRIDQLFILFIHLTPDRIIAFLKEMANDLVAKKILFSKWQLIQLLAPSLPEKCEAICIGLGEQISLFIPDLMTLSVVLSYLDLAQTLKVCSALKNYLPELIKTPQDLKIFLNLTQNDILDSVLKSSKHKIMNLISDMDTLRGVLRHVFYENATTLIINLAEKIPTLIQNADDFRYIFSYLQNKDNPGTLLDIGTEIYQKISPETISNLMLKFDDIQHVFMHLDKSKRIEIYNHNRDKILDLTNTITDVEQLFALLEPEQRQDAFEGLKHKIPGQIKTLDNLRTCFSCLDIEELQTIYPDLPINRLIKTEQDIQCLVNEADENTCARICVLLNGQISKMISDRHLIGFNENRRSQIQACFHGVTIEPKKPDSNESGLNEKEVESEAEKEEKNRTVNSETTPSIQKIQFISHKNLLILLAISLAIAISLIITASILLSLNIHVFGPLLSIGLAIAFLSILALWVATTNKPEQKQILSTADNPNRLMPSPKKYKGQTSNYSDSESYGGPLDDILFIKY